MQFCKFHHSSSLVADCSAFAASSAAFSFSLSAAIRSRLRFVTIRIVVAFSRSLISSQLLMREIVCRGSDQQSFHLVISRSTHAVAIDHHRAEMVEGHAAPADVDLLRWVVRRRFEVRQRQRWLLPGIYAARGR